jgi:hypothetical protein
MLTYGVYIVLSKPYATNIFSWKLFDLQTIHIGLDNFFHINQSVEHQITYQEVS